MNVRILNITPPWDWPENAKDLVEAALRDRTIDAADRLVAAKLAGDVTVVNDNLVELLLATLHDSTESEEMRGRAAISLGPVLELADTEGFEDPDDVPITENTFQIIVDSLRKLYVDSEVPNDVRRRVLEAAVRSPRDWHRDAIRATYSSPDPNWKLTAVFAMQWVQGFEKQILDALESENEDVRYEAVCAAGNWGIDGAWPNIASLIASGTADKPLLLAAIEAAPNIRPQDVGMILVELADSDDEDVAEAVDEAMIMAELFLHDEFDDLEDEDFPL